MDRIKKYRKCIQDALSFYANAGFGNPTEVEMRVSHDQKTDDFFLIVIGRTKVGYRHGMLMHLQLVDGKIWIHNDRTDFDLIERLVKAGVPKSDIVLGYVEPTLRAESEFAVA